MTDPLLIPIRVRPWPAGGQFTILGLQRVCGLWQTPPLPDWFLPSMIGLDAGCQVGDLEVGPVGWRLEVVSRPIPPGARLVLPLAVSPSEFGITAVGLKLGDLAPPFQEELVGQHRHAPLRRGEPNSLETKGIVSTGNLEPVGKAHGDSVVGLDESCDLLGVCMGWIVGEVTDGDEPSAAVAVPELDKFLERNPNFRWHGDSALLGASCLPPADGNRSEALLFYSEPPPSTIQRSRA